MKPMPIRSQPISPLHHSVRRRLARGWRRKPATMDWLKMPDHETAETLEKVAISIFTDAINVGAPFQDALMAVYLSGLEHGVTGSKDMTDARGGDD